MPRKSHLFVFMAAALTSGFFTFVTVNRSLLDGRAEALALRLAGHSSHEKAELIGFVESLHRNQQGYFRNKSDMKFPVIGMVPEYGVSINGNDARLRLDGRRAEDGVSMEFQFDEDGRVSEALISRGESKESWPYWTRDEHQ
ncbi:MAG: hypothetical protein IPK97_00510 [Ahniella sp.]|nr:hypothetical protein [Ahniella sp.]